MSKTKFILKEDEENKEVEEFTEDTPVEEIPEEDITQDEEDLDITPEVDEEKSFIDSDDLNSLREILLDLEDDIELLLLDDKVVVLGIVSEGTTYLYTLQDDSDDFVLIEMPLKLEEILNDPTIIKYTPEGSDERHSQVYDIFMKKLNPEQEEEVIEEEPIEPAIDEEVNEESTEEEDENNEEVKA